jgi:hypothetical protein
MPWQCLGDRCGSVGVLVTAWSPKRYAGNDVFYGDAGNAIFMVRCTVIGVHAQARACAAAQCSRRLTQSMLVTATDQPTTASA